MTPVEALLPSLVEQYGAGAVAVALLWHRVGRVESAVDELAESVDENSDAIEFSTRTHPTRRASASSTSTAAPEQRQ